MQGSGSGTFASAEPPKVKCSRCSRVLKEHVPFPRATRDRKACCGFVYPTPGSDSALNQGCTCAVIDNHHGNGFPWGSGENKFWVSANCPLHGGKE